MFALKKVAKKVLSPGLKRFAGEIYGQVKIGRAKSAFCRSRAESGYLGLEELRTLMQYSYREPDAIRYDKEGLEIRAREKVGQIRERIGLDSWSTCLELGCWDGMVSAELARLGKKAYGLDLRQDGFDKRAREAGVEFVQGDVAAMPLPDAGMDLIYSFAAFEHFSDPDSVLAQSLRVLKRGGWLYLLFGPVYTSPYGRHAYRQIPIPYCHYLFKEENLRAYARENNLEFGWPYVNGVSVTDYRKLWKKYQTSFEIIYYKEHPTGGVGAELIQKYPHCFKGKVPSCDDLFVSAIELVWRKR